MNSVLRFFTLALLSLGFASCVQSQGDNGNGKNTPAADSTKPDSAKTSQTQAPKKEFDRKFNDAARLLAGMSLEASSPYHAYTQSNDWKRFAATMDSSWAKGEKARFETMRKWVEGELQPINSVGGDLFYPFSGPDAFHAYMFFPTAKNYHLFALEVAGNLPSLDKVTDQQVTAYCRSVQNAIADFFNSSFFYTIHMQKDMPAANGTTPVLAVFLVRLGNTITNIQPVEIQADGSVQVTDKKHTSIRIDFLDAKTGEEKSLFYHACDVSNEGLVKRPALKAHLEKVAPNRTFMKSASYLLHRPNFSNLRDLILAKAPAILQDDTAVPFKFYTDAAGKWSIQLFGQYNGPIKLFAPRDQPDLREAYKKNSPKALPFTMGYHSSNNSDNVMLFKRK